MNPYNTGRFDLVQYAFFLRALRLLESKETNSLNKSQIKCSQTIAIVCGKSKGIRGDSLFTNKP